MMFRKSACAQRRGGAIKLKKLDRYITEKKNFLFTVETAKLAFTFLNRSWQTLHLKNQSTF
jgi:hypothetical protein